MTSVFLDITIYETAGLGIPHSGDLARLRPMANKDRRNHEPPDKPGGEGWLFSEQQRKLCHFKPSMATVHAQWVEVRTFSWVPPRSPMRLTHRRMLLHSAIETWQTMQRTGWVRWRPPVW